MPVVFTELAHDLELNETILRAHEQTLVAIRRDPAAFAETRFGCTPEQAIKAGAALLRSTSEKAQKAIFDFFVEYASKCPDRAERDWKKEIERAEREGTAIPLHPEQAHHPAYSIELRNEAFAEWLWVATMYGFDSPKFTRTPKDECSLDIHANKKQWQTGRWFRFGQRSWKSRVWDLVPAYPAAMLAMSGYKLASTWRCGDDLTAEEWESLGWTITTIRNLSKRARDEVRDRYLARNEPYDSSSPEVRDEVSLRLEAYGVEGLQEHVTELLAKCPFGGELPIIDVDASSAPKDATPEERAQIYAEQRQKGVAHAVQISQIWADMTNGSNLRWFVTGEKGGLHGRSMTLPPTVKGLDLLKSLKEELDSRCESASVPVMSRATGMGRRGESVSLDINTYNFAAAGRGGMWRLPGCRKDDPGSLPQTPVAEYLETYPELEPITPDKLGGDWSRPTAFHVKAIESVRKARTALRQKTEIERGHAEVGAGGTSGGFSHKPGQPVRVAEHLVGGAGVKSVTDLLVATNAKFESGNARHRLRRGVAGVMARHGYSSDAIEHTILPVSDSDTVRKIVKNIEKHRNSNMFAGANAITEAFGDEDASRSFLDELRGLLKAEAESRRLAHLNGLNAKMRAQREAKARANDIAVWREKERLLAEKIAEHNRLHPGDALVRSVPEDPESRLILVGEQVFGDPAELAAKAHDPIDDDVKKLLDEIGRTVPITHKILQVQIDEEPEEKPVVVEPPKAKPKPILPPAPPPPAPNAGKSVHCGGCDDWFLVTDNAHSGPTCTKTGSSLFMFAQAPASSSDQAKTNGKKKEPRKETELDLTRHRNGRATMSSDAQLIAEIKGDHDPNDGIDHAWRDGRPVDTQGWTYTKLGNTLRFPHAMTRSAEVLRRMEQTHIDPLIRKLAIHILTTVVAENLVWAGAPLEVIKHLGNQSGLENLRRFAGNFRQKIDNWKREDDAWPAPTSWTRLCLSANGVAKTAWTQADVSKITDALADDMADLGVPLLCRVLLLQNGGSWTNHERMAMQAVFESSQVAKDSFDKDELRSMKAFMASARCHSAYISRVCPDHGEISPTRITCKRELTCPHCRELRTNFFGTWAIGLNMWPKQMIRGTWTVPKGAEVSVEKPTDEEITSKNGKKRKKKIKVLATRPHERAMKGFSNSKAYKKLQKIHASYGKEMSESLEENRLGVRWFYDGGERVRYLIAADQEKHDDLPARLTAVRNMLHAHDAFLMRETEIISREQAIEELLLSRWREISKFDAEVFRLSRDMRAAGVDPTTKEWTNESVVSSIADANWKAFLDIPAMHVGLFKFHGNKWAERHVVEYKKPIPPHEEVAYTSNGLVPWFSSKEMYERIRAIKDKDIPESEKVPPHLCPVPIGKTPQDTKERCRKPLDRMVRTVATNQVVCRLNAPDDRADPDTIWEELDRYKVRAGVPRGMAWFTARAQRLVA